MKNIILLSAALVFGALTSAVSAADWALVTDESRVSFVSVKAETIGETHYFADIQGSVTPAGKVVIELPLESVETAIDIRNDRMREFFFKTVNFPTATITTALSPADYIDIEVGSRSMASLSAQINLHGVTSDIEFDAFVTRIADNKFAVDTAAPILLDVDEFELGSGLDKLKELAGLDMISPIVPVTASLVFLK